MLSVPGFTSPICIAHLAKSDFCGGQISHTSRASGPHSIKVRETVFVTCLVRQSKYDKKSRPYFPSRCPYRIADLRDNLQIRLQRRPRVNAEALSQQLTEELIKSNTYVSPIFAPEKPIAAPQKSAIPTKLRSKALVDISDRMTSAKVSDRMSAILALKKIDETEVAIDFSLWALKDSAVNVRLAAINVMSTFPSRKCTKALEALLADRAEDYRIRANAAGALGAIEDPTVTKTLLNAVMDDPEWIVRISAVTSLGYLRYRELEDCEEIRKIVFETLAYLLSSNDDLLMVQAALGSLGVFGDVEDKRAVDFLLPKFIRVSDWMTRHRLVIALESLFQRSVTKAEILFALEVLMSDENDHVKDAATQALLRIRGGMSPIREQS